MPAANAKKKTRIGPGRLSAEAAAELPDRLLDAAFEQFTDVGFEGATMDQIAKRAGASTKTLYSRFANKGDMLEAVVRRNVQRTVADHLRIALNPAETEPREFLHKFTMQIGIANLAHDTGGLVRVSFSEAHRNPVLLRIYEEVTGRAIIAIAHALRVWREAGLVAFDDDVEQLAAVAFGMMTHEMRVRAVLGKPMPRAEIQRYSDLAVDIFMSYVTKDLPAPKKRASRK